MCTSKLINALTGGRIAIQSLQTVQPAGVNTSLIPLLCLLQIFFQSFYFIPFFFCLLVITHRLTSLKSIFRPNSLSDGLIIISRLNKMQFSENLVATGKCEKLKFKISTCTQGLLCFKVKAMKSQVQ